MKKNSLEIKEDLARLTESEIIDRDLKIFEAIKQHRLPELGWWGVETIADRHNLELFVEFFKTFTVLKSGQCHGIREMLSCYERAYYEKLSDTEKRAQAVAALFHDFQCIDKFEPNAIIRLKSFVPPGQGGGV